MSAKSLAYQEVGGEGFPREVLLHNRLTMKIITHLAVSTLATISSYGAITLTLTSIPPATGWALISSNISGICDVTISNNESTTLTPLNMEGVSNLGWEVLLVPLPEPNSLSLLTLSVPRPGPRRGG